MEDINTVENKDKFDEGPLSLLTATVKDNTQVNPKP